MNEVIQSLMNHRSIRQYKAAPLPKTYIEAIVDAAQMAPSWINGQHVSIISVQDNEKKEKLAALTGNQAAVAQAPVFFVFCMDFQRTSLASKKHSKPLAVVDDIESIMVGSVDVGLALGNAIAAAESLGLGTVPIGGIRRNPLEVIDLLQLPSYVVPISGLCVGYADHVPEIKPRLPKESVYHHEQYTSVSEETLDQYDEIIAKDNHLRSNGKTDSSWTSRVATFYEKPYYLHSAKMLKQQGFTCKNMK